MSAGLKVLIVEDSYDDALLMVHELKRSGFTPEFRVVDTAHAFLDALAEGSWDVVLSDSALPYFDGMLAFDLLLQEGLDIPFILVSGHLGEERAVEAMRRGVKDCILKDNLARLVPAVDRELKEADGRRQRRAAAEALRESEEKYHHLLESSIQGVAVIRDFKVLFANPAFAELLGYKTVAQLTGAHSILGHIVPEDHSKLMQGYWARPPGRKMHARTEVRMVRKDGATVIVNASLTAVRWEGEDAVMAILVDITESKRAQEALERAHAELETRVRERTAELAESEQRFRTIVSNVPGVVFQQRLGKDGVPAFTFFSERLRTVMGIVPADLLAAPEWIESHFLPEDLELRRSSLRDSAANLTLRDIEMRYRHPDGTLHWLQLRAQPHRESGGDIVWDGILHDITDRRRLEDSLRHSERLQAIAELTDGVAHNFNNLLAIIAGFAENIAMEAAGNARIEDCTAQIESAVGRGARLVKDLRDFSRGGLPGSELLPMTDVLRMVQSLAQPILSDAVALNIQSGPQCLQAKVDFSRLQTALLHLVLNARDALVNGGEITLSAQNVSVRNPEAAALGVVPGQYVRVSIKDNGVGMTKEVLERATNPFFSTKPVGKGSGLGLSMVYGFTKQSGGALRIDSSPETGTEITMTLPAQEAAGAPN